MDPFVVQHLTLMCAVEKRKGVIRSDRTVDSSNCRPSEASVFRSLETHRRSIRKGLTHTLNRTRTLEGVFLLGWGIIEKGIPENQGPKECIVAFITY